MQFTIRRLLLIFPAFFVGAFIAVIVNSGTCVIYKWTVAYNYVRQINREVEFYKQLNRNTDVPVELIDNWLAGTLPPNHPLSQELRDAPRSDPWGNPYRCVYHTTDTGNQIGVYSCGRDGLSDSNGNDYDDLNSWNGDCYRWYVRDINNRNRMTCAIQGAVIAPFVYAGMLGIAWLVRWPRKPIERAYQIGEREGSAQSVLKSGSSPRPPLP